MQNYISRKTSGNCGCSKVQTGRLRELVRELFLHQPASHKLPFADLQLFRHQPKLKACPALNSSKTLSANTPPPRLSGRAKEHILGGKYIPRLANMLDIILSWVSGLASWRPLFYRIPPSSSARGWGYGPLYASKAFEGRKLQAD